MDMVTKPSHGARPLVWLGHGRDWCQREESNHGASLLNFREVLLSVTIGAKHFALFDFRQQPFR